MKTTTLLLGLFFILLTPFAQSAHINCKGKVSWLMADHSACGGHMAFKTDATGGRGGKWMCTKSKEAGSIALTALTADKTVEVYIEAGDVSSCKELPHYRKIAYIIINP